MLKVCKNSLDTQTKLFQNDPNFILLSGLENFYISILFNNKNHDSHDFLRIDS